ncbi:transient receptor potential protein-like [Cherax quadricarinatus]
MSRETATFTKDITPIILAAHHNHYEILKLLLDRGASLPMPHDIRCGCDECLISTEEDSLRHSLSRINAYKALASPSLIALSSKDPIRTAFELSGELARLQGMEHEFKQEYNELRQKVMKFGTELLDQTRSRTELSIMLNYDPEGPVWEEGEVNSLERLKMAIKFSQKSFVAHPNVQQLLGAIWYDGLPGFRRKDLTGQCVEVAKLACMFPVLSFAYIFCPSSSKGKFIKKPFVKFITHCASYMLFLMLLALASQRIEYMFIEWFGNAWLHSVLEDWKLKERGSFPGFFELAIIMYIFSLIWSEIKSLWSDGLLEYVKDLWNIIDYITNMFFMTWLLMRATSIFLVQKDLWNGIWPYYPREAWDPYDPLLISEGCFGAAMIFSFLKLVHIFSVNPHLGPLQISLGRMIFDILKFFFLYTLVLFAFGCGMNQLMWYYAELEMKKCYHLPDGQPDREKESQACFIWRRWTNLFETSQSLFWASFGLVDLDSFELTGVGSFTRFWAMLMFGSYSVINVIVLLNLLIAMMSNSYNIISERSDMEWKFARTKLWLSYFEDGATVPPPFNVIPSPKSFIKLLGLAKEKIRGSFKAKSRKMAEQKHANVMRLLVRRYITEQQRRADERRVTEDDINEVKQDISTFRYELVDILRNNGMNTSMVHAEDTAVIGKKGRAMERRLLKGFNIGLVEGIITDILTSEKKPKNIFGKLARAIGKKKKEDWNARVSRASTRRDQIGSSETSLMRSQTSIKRRIQYENEMLLKSLNPEKIAEYNPNLEIHTPTTRIAYARFKVNTLKKEKERKLAEENKAAAQEKAGVANQMLKIEKMQQNASKPFVSRSPSPLAPLGTSPDSVPKSAVAYHLKPEVVPKTPDQSVSKPTPTQDVKPAQTQDVKPAPTQDVKPASAQDAKPALTQDAKPASTQDAKPALTQDAKPASTQDAKPASIKDAKPAPPQDAKPAPPQDAKPSLPQDAKPAPPQDAKPASPQDAKPALIKDAKPAPPQDIKPAPPQDAKPAQRQAPKPSKPSGSSVLLPLATSTPLVPSRPRPGKLAVPKAFQHEAQQHLPPPRTKPPPRQIVQFPASPAQKFQTKETEVTKTPTPSKLISPTPFKPSSGVPQEPKPTPRLLHVSQPTSIIPELPKLTPSLPQGPKPMPSPLQEPKPTPSLAQESKPTPSLPQKPKLTFSLPQEPKPTPSLPQKPKLTFSLPQEPKPTPILSQTPKPTPSPPQGLKPTPSFPQQPKPTPSLPQAPKPPPKSEVSVSHLSGSSTPSEPRGRSPETISAGKSQVTGQVRTGWL